jgi:hypothetical protein
MGIDDTAGITGHLYRAGAGPAAAQPWAAPAAAPCGKENLELGGGQVAVVVFIDIIEARGVATEFPPRKLVVAVPVFFLDFFSGFLLNFWPSESGGATTENTRTSAHILRIRINM